MNEDKKAGFYLALYSSGNFQEHHLALKAGCHCASDNLPGGFIFLNL